VVLLLNGNGASLTDVAERIGDGHAETRDGLSYPLSREVAIRASERTESPYRDRTRRHVVRAVLVGVPPVHGGGQDSQSASLERAAEHVRGGGAAVIFPDGGRDG
jgi:hypothetical protein